MASSKFHCLICRRELVVAECELIPWSVFQLMPADAGVRFVVEEYRDRLVFSLLCPSCLLRRNERLPMVRVESDLEAHEKLEHALRLLRQVQLHPKVSDRVVCAIVPIQNILKLLE